MRTIAIVIFVLIIKGLTHAQSNNIIDFSLTTNCSIPNISVSYDIDLTDVDYFTGTEIGEGIFFSYSTPGTVRGSVTIAATGFCSATNRSLEMIFTDTFDLTGLVDCRTLAYNHIPGLGQSITLTITFTPSRLTKPSATIFPGSTAFTVPCGVTNTDISTVGTGSGFIWEKSNNGIDWIQITGVGLRATTINITAQSLHDASFGGSPYGAGRYVRVRPTVCSFVRVSEIVGPIIFYAAPPSFTTNEVDPLCTQTASGRVNVTTFEGYTQTVDYIVVLRDHLNFDVPGQGPIILSDGELSDGHSFNNVPAGTYKVRIQNNGEGGCATEEEDIVLTDPPKITATLNTKVDAPCNGNDSGPKTGSIKLDVTHGNGPFSYQYALKGSSTFNTITAPDPTSRTPLFSNLTPNTYRFKVKHTPIDGLDCLSEETAEITIIEPPAIAATLVEKIDVTCRGEETGSISINSSGGSESSSFAYVWTGPSYSSNLEDISSLAAGTYQLRLIKGECSKPDAVVQVIHEPGERFRITSTITSRDIHDDFDVSCRGNDGSISLTTSNEPGRFVNEALTTWRKNNIPFTPSSNYFAENLTPGQYRIEMFDNMGCRALELRDLSPHPGITVITEANTEFNGYATSCATSADGKGGVTEVHNARNGIAYQWEVNGSEWQTIEGLAAGTYKVTATDGNGCVDDGFLTITSPPEIDPNLQVVSNYNGDQISCPEAADGIIEAFPLNGFGPYTYEWDHGVFTKTADNLAQGTYRVTVRDQFGCEASASLDIHDPPVMQTEITTSDFNGASVSCFEGNDGEAFLTILEGVPQSYEWSNEATTQNVSGLAAGTYEVAITSINGCVVHNSVEITEPEKVTSSISHAVNYSGFGVRCFGDENGSVVATASGGVAPYTYAWSNGITDPLNENIGLGKYLVTVTDLNGCAKKDSIVVTEPPLLSLTGEQIEAVSCYGLKDGIFRLQGVGGAGEYRYSMDPSTWQNSRYFDTLSVGTKHFYVMDQNGCEASTTGVVTQPDVLEVYFPPESIVKAACNDPVGSVLAVAAGGNGGYQFSWVNDMDQTPLGSEATLEGLIAGIYGVTVKDARGCEIADRVAVSSIGGAEFTIENIKDVSCFGGNDGEASARIVSAELPVTYLWSSNATDAKATSLTSGKYFLTVTDNLGCKTIQSFNIGTPDALRAGIVKTLPLCHGDCNGLLQSSPTGGTAPYQFTWKDHQATLPELNNLCAGNYQLTITDEQGCELTEDIILSEPELLHVEAVATPPICLGRCDGILTATATGGTGSYLYAWDTGRNEATINELCSGDYELTVQDVNNCLATGRFTVPEGEILTIDLGELETLCVGQTKALDPGSQWVTVHWVANNGFESRDRAITINQEGIYRIDAVNNIGCLGTGAYELRTSLDLLQASFILQTEAVVGDTLVAIDISWPLPDSTQWVYPSVMSALVETDDFLYFIPTEAGDYQVTMRSFLGECRAFEEKQLLVRVREADEDANGRLGFEGIVTSTVLSPNPSNGVFELQVETSRPVPMHIRVVEPLTGRVVADQQESMREHFLFGFDLSHLTAGVYFVWMQAGDEKHLWRLVKY